MPLESKRRHIHDPVLLSLKMECIRLLYVFKGRLVCKKSKLKLYCSIIRPTVTYGCEPCVLKETIKNKLMIFERKVLRRIFGFKKERDGT
jgi:hypothetical protein